MSTFAEKVRRLIQGTVIKAVASDNYTILDNDNYTEIHVTTGNSDRTVTLPTLADNLNRKIIIRKVDTGTGKVIIDGEGAETIDGDVTTTAPRNGSWVEVVGGSTEWKRRESPEIKIITGTRDASTASASQAVTGVGFKPRKVTVLIGINTTTKIMSIGISAGILEGTISDYTQYPSGWYVNADLIANMVHSNTAYNQVVVNSMDLDGATLAWVKTGSPTGTYNYAYFFER